MKEKADDSRKRENMNSLKLNNNMLTTRFQTIKLVIHVAKMQQILFFVQVLMMNFNIPIGNVYCGSVLNVILLLYQELKNIHRNEHQ